jgi:hypothetical protein
MIARLGGVVTQASGTLGGMTFANKGGVLVVGARARRAKQNTPAQQDAQAMYVRAREAFRLLPALTQYAWKAYVIQHPRVNRLGVARRLNVTQFYLSQAIPRMRAGLGSPGSPPAKPQQSVGYPSTIAFASGGPYTFSFISPAGDPNGYYLVDAARTMSTTALGRLCPRALPAIQSKGSCSVDVHDAFVELLGEIEVGEIVVLSIRYAGGYSIISARVRYTLTAI